MELVQPRIFISHSSTDLPFVHKLADDLQHALGNKEAVWYDTHLEGGEQWWRKIVEELRRSTVCLVVCSPAAMASDWVNDEIDLAWRLKNSPVRMRLIPLLYQPCQLRYELENLQCVHFLAPKPYRKEAFSPQKTSAKDETYPGRTRRPNSAPPPSVLTSFFRRFPLASLLASSLVVRSRSAKMFLFIALLLLVIVSSVFAKMMLSPSRSPSQSYSQATDHSPVFVDPLKDNSSGHNWFERDNDLYGGCSFKEGAYHVTAQPGVDFRFTSPNNGYLFYIFEDGTYTVVREVGQSNMTQNIILQHAFSSAINTQPRESNLLAILARGTTFDLYVNNHYVTSFSDNTYSRGNVENLAVSNSSNEWTDIVFRNVKAWAI